MQVFKLSNWAFCTWTSKSDNFQKTAFPIHRHLHSNFMKKYTSYLNKQWWKRKSAIWLTTIHWIDWHSGRVVICTQLWNHGWIHAVGLLSQFERTLLSGGVYCRDSAVVFPEMNVFHKIYVYFYLLVYMVAQRHAVCNLTQRHDDHAPMKLHKLTLSRNFTNLQIVFM